MSRMPSVRSVKTSVHTRPCGRPIAAWRRSPSTTRERSTTTAPAQSKAQASSNEIPCLARFRAAFSGSHANGTI